MSTLGLDPLTPTTSRTWGPLLALADENASSSHPLPQEAVSKLALSGANRRDGEEGREHGARRG